MRGVRKVHGRCAGGVQKVCGRHAEGVQEVHGRCTGGVMPMLPIATIDLVGNNRKSEV